MLSRQDDRQDGTQAVPSAVGRRRAAHLLRARELLRAGLPDRALAEIRAAEDALPAGRNLEITLLRGAAMLALGRWESGTKLLQEVIGAGDVEQRLEASTWLAEGYLRTEWLHEAEAALAPMLEAAASVPAALAARALAAYGRVERARGRRSVAARYFLDALEALDRGAPDDARQRSALLYDVVETAVQTLDPRLFERVRHRAAADASPGREGAALRGIRVVAELLCGQVEAAWDVAFAELRCVPGGMASAGAFLGAAAAARAAGETFTPDRLVLQAARAAEAADWQHADAGERRVLLRLAVALAPLDARRAAKLLRVHDALGCLPLGVADLRAARAMAHAAVLGASGLPDEQVVQAQGARTTAREAGDQLAEVEALLVLIAGHPDEDALQRCDELTRLVRDSWLRRSYEACAQYADGLGQLSPAERRVMDAICKGLSGAQIAREFGRSPHTIRNQTRRVYDVMGVRTRSALVAKCARQGLVPPP